MDDTVADPIRSMIAIEGEDAVHFLQGILTQDIARLAHDRIQFAALLSPQGKILHDMFVIDGNAIGAPALILLDTPSVYAPLLLKRLAMYKLRSRVTMMNGSERWHVGYSASKGFADPRHPGLPQRHYSAMSLGENSPALVSYHRQRIGLGIPDSSRDFEPDSLVLLDAGYDLLNGVSFTKGCYVGQEVVARMHYKHVARRGFYILKRNHVPERLACLKFADMDAAGGTVSIENVDYQAYLPTWMTPRYMQYQENKEKIPPASL